MFNLYIVNNANLYHQAEYCFSIGGEGGGLLKTAQLVKKCLQCRRPSVWFLGQEDPLERGQATTPVFLGFPCGSAGKQSSCNAGDLRFDIWVGKIPWGRDRLPTPVFWPGEFHGLYSPWGCKESDTTEQLSLSLFSLKIGGQKWNTTLNYLKISFFLREIHQK